MILSCPTDLNNIYISTSPKCIFPASTSLLSSSCIKSTAIFIWMFNGCLKLHIFNTSLHYSIPSLQTFSYSTVLHLGKWQLHSSSCSVYPWLFSFSTTSHLTHREVLLAIPLKLYIESNRLLPLLLTWRSSHYLLLILLPLNRSSCFYHCTPYIHLLREASDSVKL